MTVRLNPNFAKHHLAEELDASGNTVKIIHQTTNMVLIERYEQYRWVYEDQLSPQVIYSNELYNYQYVTNIYTVRSVPDSSKRIRKPDDDSYFRVVNHKGIETWITDRQWEKWPSSYRSGFKIMYPVKTIDSYDLPETTFKYQVSYDFDLFGVSDTASDSPTYRVLIVTPFLDPEVKDLISFLTETFGSTMEILHRVTDEDMPDLSSIDLVIFDDLSGVRSASDEVIKINTRIAKIDEQIDRLVELSDSLKNSQGNISEIQQEFSDLFNTPPSTNQGSRPLVTIQKTSDSSNVDQTHKVAITNYLGAIKWVSEKKYNDTYKGDGWTLLTESTSSLVNKNLKSWLKVNRVYLQ
jgi:hypothetical protein